MQRASNNDQPPLGQLAFLLACALLSAAGLIAKTAADHTDWLMRDLRAAVPVTLLPGAAGEAARQLFADLQATLPAAQRPFRLLLEVPEGAAVGSGLGAELAVATSPGQRTCLEILTFAAPAVAGTAAATTPVTARIAVDDAVLTTWRPALGQGNRQTFAFVPAAATSRLRFEVLAAPPTDGAASAPEAIGFEYLQVRRCRQ